MDLTQCGMDPPARVAAPGRERLLFKPPRPLTEIDAELKVVTDRIVQMLGGLSQ